MAVVRGGAVRPHAQAFANDLQNATGASSFGTYPGHSPSLDRALDIFHPIGDDATADAICRFALDHWEHYGLDYIISRQTQSGEYRGIYNPEVARHWRTMSDRGGATQNHFDHVHVSFEPTGNASAPVPRGPDIPPLDIPPWPGRYFRHPPVVQGEDVARWQNRMRSRGWRIDVDGAYGPQSAEVCLGFQREKGLGPDGIVGPRTWEAAWSTPIT